MLILVSLCNPSSASRAKMQFDDGTSEIYSTGVPEKEFIAGFEVKARYKCIDKFDGDYEVNRCTDFWCDATCNHDPSNCPSTICRPIAATDDPPLSVAESTNKRSGGADFEDGDTVMVTDQVAEDNPWAAGKEGTVKKHRKDGKIYVTFTLGPQNERSAWGPQNERSAWFKSGELEKGNMCVELTSEDVSRAMIPAEKGHPEFFCCAKQCGRCGGLGCQIGALPSLQVPLSFIPSLPLSLSPSLPLSEWFAKNCCIMRTEESRKSCGGPDYNMPPCIVYSDPNSAIEPVEHPVEKQGETPQGLPVSHFRDLRADLASQTP